MTTSSDPWRHDPRDVNAPFTFEWDDWLPGDATVTTATVDVAAGLTKVSHQIDENPKHVTFRVSGGAITNPYTKVRVDIDVVTSEGVTWHAFDFITIRERRS